MAVARTNTLAISGFVMTDSYIRLPTRGGYRENSSLPPGSRSFLGPKSTLGLPGMFEFAEISYCATRFSAYAV